MTNNNLLNSVFMTKKLMGKYLFYSCLQVALFFCVIHFFPFLLFHFSYIALLWYFNNLRIYIYFSYCALFLQKFTKCTVYTYIAYGLVRFLLYIHIGETTSQTTLRSSNIVSLHLFANCFYFKLQIFFSLIYAIL